MARIELRGLSKRFGRTDVIRGVDLDVADGSFVVLVGPSGCGKSTLLRLIAGLEDISDGELRFDGERVNALPPKARGVAMVFQSYALYPHMTAYQNMAFGLTLDRSDPRSIDERVRTAADMLELGQLLDRLPRELSGGQRQRVAIGRAIVRQPRVFLFDEPLSNLDAALRVQMRLELARLHEQLRSTVIYVTHDQVEAMTLADQVVVLSEGRIEQVGRPLDLYHRPANRFVAGFIGSPRMNFIGVTVRQASAAAVTVELPGGASCALALDGTSLQAGQALTLGVRPEHLHVFDAGSDAGHPGSPSGDGSGHNPDANPDANPGHPPLLYGQVRRVEALGDATLLHVRVPGADAAADGLVTVRCDGQVTLGRGASTRVRVDTAHGHLFDAQGRAVPAARGGP